MPVRKRNISRRQSLDSNAEDWLCGRSQACSFFEFKPDDELEELWNSHGEPDSMFYKRGMSLPITLDDLEERENAWLGTGKGSKYGGEAFFVYQHYTEDEKQSLWSARGDKKRYDWKPGMYRPEPI